MRTSVVRRGVGPGRTPPLDHAELAALARLRATVRAGQCVDRRRRPRRLPDAARRPRTPASVPVHLRLQRGRLRRRHRHHPGGAGGGGRGHAVDGAASAGLHSVVDRHRAVPAPAGLGATARPRRLPSTVLGAPRSTGRLNTRVLCAASLVEHLADKPTLGQVTIRYDTRTRCHINVRSKANTSQLNVPHGTDN